MPLVLRRNKGSALTYDEVDDNFVYTLQNFENSGFKVTANTTFISFYKDNTIIARMDGSGNLSVKGNLTAYANTASW